MLCFSKLRKHRYGIRIAKTNKIGVQATSGRRVKRKVVNPPSTIARTTTPTARLLRRYDAASVKTA